MTPIAEALVTVHRLKVQLDDAWEMLQTQPTSSRDRAVLRIITRKVEDIATHEALADVYQEMR